MRFGNGTIFLPARGFVPGGFAVEAGRFTRVWEGDDGPCDRDLAGACVIPGLIDLHIHGAVGADFSDADLAGLTRMAAFLASQGVTGFVPTSMSLSYEALADAFATEKALAEDRPAGCARPLGVHMEGPFFSAENAARRTRLICATRTLRSFEGSGRLPAGASGSQTPPRSFRVPRHLQKKPRRPAWSPRHTPLQAMTRPLPSSGQAPLTSPICSTRCLPSCTGSPA